MSEFVKLYYTNDSIKQKCKGGSRKTIESIKSVMKGLAKKYPEKKYAKGGEFEEEESMDVQFIEYNGEEIMYEPIMKKYYANDVEFDTLKEAQKFLDSGKMSDSIRGAYARGLYEKGGELKKPTWIAIYEKGRERKVFELSANSREEAKIEAAKGKKQYKIPKEMFLYDVYRKFAHGGEVSSQKIYEVEYEIGGKKHTSEYMMYDWERVENKFPPETKIISIKEKYAKGGEIGFEGLANKVAKRYVRKKVSKEYQAEYGKTYDAKEAKEVGNKVAAKVYRQQVAKKKIVRKLQRKTN